ncbi:ABC transporter ATP-binding protein, partial [Mycobacterium tuberculosis]|nr:ABC transporter ATP-binding protein [Mycobacterium tuberculosis]
MAGLVGAGRTELACKLFGCWPGDHEGQIFLDGAEIRVKDPAEAVGHGICMVPEDRKRHGIVPLMGVGHNITMSVLGRFT